MELVAYPIFFSKGYDGREWVVKKKILKNRKKFKFKKKPKTINKIFFQGAA